MGLDDRPSAVGWPCEALQIPPAAERRWLLKNNFLLLPADLMTMINKTSSRITQPKSQGASQAMLYGTGMTEEDMQKAQVGIASVWYEGNTCNMHLNDLSAAVKEGVTASGMVGMRFNTVGVLSLIHI